MNNSSSDCDSETDIYNKLDDKKLRLIKLNLLIFVNTDSNDTLNEVLNPYLTQLISLNHNALYNIKNCFNYFTNRTILWQQNEKKSLIQLLCTVSMKQTEIHKDINNWLSLINAIYIKQKKIYEKQLKELFAGSFTDKRMMAKFEEGQAKMLQRITEEHKQFDWITQTNDECNFNAVKQEDDFDKQMITVLNIVRSLIKSSLKNAELIAYATSKLKISNVSE